MAVQFSATSSLWTDATWQTVDSTSYLKSEAASTTTTTSYVASQTFIPGVITVEGILLRVKGTTTTPTGTFSVELYNSTGAASVATVTCNATDIINNNTGLEGGWMYFKFGSPVALLAATAYSIRIKSSVNAIVTVYRNATAGNWSRGLVTSTTASLAASDDVIICGNVTAAATTTVNTVTFDYTGANAYNSVEVGAYGKLICENLPSTTYKLTINNAGILRISHNGIFEVGNSLNRLDSTSSFILQLNCSSAASNYVDVRNFGTFRMFGAVKTRKCLLTTNASIGATSLTTDIITNWNNGDDIAIAGTGANSHQQQRVLNANATTTTLSISSSLTYATEGTSPVQADIINLTSNIKILGTSATLVGYTILQQSSIYDVDQVEYKFMGNASTTAGITINSNANSNLGVVSIVNCTFWNYVNYGISAPSQYNGIYLDGIYSYLPTQNGYHFNFYNSGEFTSYLKNITVIGGNNGLSYNAYNKLIIENYTAANVWSNGMIIVGYMGRNAGSLIGAKIYRCTASMNMIPASAGYIIDRMYFRDLTIFRCNQGLSVGSSTNLIFEDCNIFSNLNWNIYFTATLAGISAIMNTKFINCNIQAGTGVVCPVGVSPNQYNYNGGQNIVFERCNIGTITPHSSGDVGTTIYNMDWKFNKCNFGSSILVSSPNSLKGSSKITFQNNNGVSGNNLAYKPQGIIRTDTTIFDTSSSSIRLTPSNSASVNPSPIFKLESTSFQIAVASGSIATFSIKVRKSVVGDGTAYNGNQPRLILKSNPSAGSAYNSDIVCATASAAAGTWETLSYTLPSAVTDNVGMEFYVDCDGTTGWVNVDTFVSNNNNNMTYYLNGEPIQDIPSAGATETAYTFIT